jgi:hypothetical protein
MIPCWQWPIIIRLAVSPMKALLSITKSCITFPKLVCTNTTAYSYSTFGVNHGRHIGHLDWRFPLCFSVCPIRATCPYACFFLIFDDGEQNFITLYSTKFSILLFLHLLAFQHARQHLEPTVFLWNEEQIRKHNEIIDNTGVLSCGF